MGPAALEASFTSISDIGLLSYGSAWFAYCVLGVALTLFWRDRSIGMAMILATVLTAAWGAVIAIATLFEYPPVGLIQAAEITRNAAWIFLLLSILGSRLKGTDHILASRRWLPWYTVGASLVTFVIYGTPVLGAFLQWPETLIRNITFGAWLAISLLCLLLVEQLYRNSTDRERWSIKYLCLGLAFMFGYDFLMYTEALLLARLDSTLWQARGIAVALTAPLMGMAASRARARTADWQHARHMVFHTFTLLAAGVYLLFMAVVGYLVSFLGGTWGGVLQITFLSATGLLLLVLLASGQVRARTRVWLSKTFFSYKYDYRREWLEFTQTLAVGRENTPRAVTQAMASLAQFPAALLWGRSENGNYDLIDHWQTDSPRTPEDLRPLAEWLRRTEWIIDLQEYRNTPGLYRELELPRFFLDIPQARLIVPLMFGERVEGIILLHNSSLHPELTWEDRDLLKVAGRQAATYLAQYQNNKTLVEMRQFEAFNRLSAYVVHDLKNILAQQSLIVSNAQKHRDKPEFIDDVFDTVGNSVDRMTRLMEQMRSGLRGTTKEPLELSALLAKTVTGCRNAAPRPILQPVAAEQWVEGDKEQLATVIAHLIENAQQATPKEGHVLVRLLQQHGQAIVEIEDNGEGMDDHFIQNRLFKLFDTTKGLTGMGIGVYESREYMRSLGGDILVESQKGIGSCFRVVLPCLSHR